MSKIIFEYTKFGKYAAQGGSPSGKEGYNIWAQYPDDDMVHFLGFCDPIDFDYNVAYYIGSGDEVYLSRRENRKETS